MTTENYDKWLIEHWMQRAIKAEAAVLQQEAGEPVGVASAMPGTSGFTMACFKAEAVPVGTKLYAAPTPQAVKVPLTPMQYNAIPELSAIRPSLYESIVRAIEAAHGIHPTEGERSHD